MFTIRHIKADGHESIREARSVTSNTAAKVQTVVVDGETLRDGAIYVMNEMGRTVAKYDLGPPLTGVKAVQDLTEKFPEGVIRG